MTEVDDYIHNFQNTALRIQYFIEQFNIRKFEDLSVLMKFRLYQSYVCDNKDDGMADIFYRMTDADMTKFFDCLLYPGSQNDFKIRTIILKYLCKNYSEFFNKIFDYLSEKWNVESSNQPLFDEDEELTYQLKHGGEA